MNAIALSAGLVLYPGYLAREAQEALLDDIGAVVRAAPLYTPRMPRTGKPFSVRMTNCGSLGWVSDEIGYRYQPNHPGTAEPWPAMPARLLDIWRALSGYPHPPEACLVNFYDVKARMGLHQDRDEQDFDAPVVSLSLGDAALFRFGGAARTDRTRSIRLESGDALVFGGPARLMFHGVDRVIPGPASLLEDEGRLNLTLRRVHRP